MADRLGSTPEDELKARPSISDCSALTEPKLRRISPETNFHLLLCRCTIPFAELNRGEIRRLLLGCPELRDQLSKRMATYLDAAAKG